MKVAKWGNSLAIRLPAELVARLGLMEGDEIEVIAKAGSLEVDRKMSVDELFQSVRNMPNKFPADFKFDREDAHSRGRDGD